MYIYIRIRMRMRGKKGRDRGLLGVSAYHDRKMLIYKALATTTFLPLSIQGVCILV